MKRSFWARRKSMSLPTMTIRRNLPLPIRIFVIALVLGLAAAMGMWAFDLGRSITGFNPTATREQMGKLKEQIEKLTSERDALSTTANAAESTLNIERSVQKQLAAQAKTLEVENSKLKEDLAFFESLLPTDTGPGGISITRLKVKPVGPNQVRYQLLVMQGGKGASEFSGNLQLAIMGLQGGKNVMMVFPAAGSAGADKFKLSFKHYLRIDDVLTLPEGLTVKTVQARILDKGQIRTQQSANL